MELHGILSNTKRLQNYDIVPMYLTRRAHHQPYILPETDISVLGYRGVALEHYAKRQYIVAIHPPCPSFIVLRGVRDYNFWRLRN